MATCMTLLLHAREGFPILQRFLSPLLEMNSNRRRQRKASEQYRAIQNPPAQGFTTLRNLERISFCLSPPKALSLLQSQCIPSANPQVSPKRKGQHLHGYRDGAAQSSLLVPDQESAHWTSTRPTPTPLCTSQDHLLLAQVMGKDPSQMPAMSCIFSAEQFCQHTSNSFTDIWYCCLPLEPESTKDPKAMLMKQRFPLSSMQDHRRWMLPAD